VATLFAILLSEFFGFIALEFRPPLSLFRLFLYSVSCDIFMAK